MHTDWEEVDKTRDEAPCSTCFFYCLVCEDYELVIDRVYMMPISNLQHDRTSEPDLCV